MNTCLPSTSKLSETVAHLGIKGFSTDLGAIAVFALARTLSPLSGRDDLHTVDGRDAEIASALSDLAAFGDASRLPKPIVIKH
jgi:hypothetical protein